jgi:hypothetical protein
MTRHGMRGATELTFSTEFDSKTDGPCVMQVLAKDECSELKDPVSCDSDDVLLSLSKTITASLSEMEPMEAFPIEDRLLLYPNRLTDDAFLGIRRRLDSLANRRQ